MAEYLIIIRSPDGGSNITRSVGLEEIILRVADDLEINFLNNDTIAWMVNDKLQNPGSRLDSVATTPKGVPIFTIVRLSDTHFDPIKNAGQLRTDLVKKCRKIKNDDPAVCCWTDLYDHVRKDVLDLALRIHRCPAYVMSCLIDDLEADLVDDSE